MRILVFVLMVLGCGSCWAEGSCFRTPSQAAVQVGEAEGGGYRLMFVRVDPFGGKTWAGVRSCLHPEWPTVLVSGIVPISDSKVRADAVKSGAETRRPDIVGGRTVRVVKTDALVRIETTGVAQASGRVGDRIWVRVAGPGEDRTGHLELGLVRSAELLEIGQ
jgi:hypothetical protein